MRNRAGPTTLVSDLMKSPVLTASSEDKLSRLVAMVSTRRIRHFPVVEEGKLIGIVTDSDLRAETTHPAVGDLLLDLLASLDRDLSEKSWGAR